MFCQSCGKMIADGSRNCPYCGNLQPTNHSYGWNQPQQQPYQQQPYRQSYQQPYQQPYPPQQQYRPPQQQYPQPAYQPIPQGVSDKSKAAVALFAFFLGTFGIHRFYVGKVGSGLAMLLMTVFGIFTAFIIVGFFLIAASSIWALVDFIMALCGAFTDQYGRYVKY